MHISLTNHKLYIHLYSNETANNVAFSQVLMFIYLTGCGVEDIMRIMHVWWCTRSRL